MTRNDDLVRVTQWPGARTDIDSRAVPITSEQHARLVALGGDLSRVRLDDEGALVYLTAPIPKQFCWIGPADLFELLAEIDPILDWLPIN